MAHCTSGELVFHPQYCIQQKLRDLRAILYWSVSCVADVIHRDRVSTFFVFSKAGILPPVKEVQCLM